MQKPRKYPTNHYPPTTNHFPRTIRARLTLWFVGSVLAVFAVFVIVNTLIFWRILNFQVDHHIQTVLNEVETIWGQNSMGRSELIESLVAAQGMIVMIMAPDGEVLLQTTSLDTTLPTQHELQRHLVMLKNQPTGLPHHFTINNTRFALATTPIAPDQGVIGVGYSLNVLQAAINQSLVVVGGLVLVFIGIFGVLGYFLAHRALAPVAAMTKTAQTITTSQDLQGRIPDPGTQDELGTLVRILNEMIGRLENSFNVQQQFFADAAHTLKTPITAVRTQLENIQSSLQKDHPASRREIKRVMATIDHISRVVKDLLYLSRVSLPEFVKFETLDLTEILNEVCELARALASGKNIRIECHIESDLDIKGDKSLILRAILNVVENAVHYTPIGGSVVIDAHRRHNRPVTLTVKDNGIGIPTHQVGQVFERFFRASNIKDQKMGTGLGLAITKAVVEVHRGSIDLRSLENEGTTVVIVLPTE